MNQPLSRPLRHRLQQELDIVLSGLFVKHEDVTKLKILQSSPNANLLFFDYDNVLIEALKRVVAEHIIPSKLDHPATKESIRAWLLDHYENLQPSTATYISTIALAKQTKAKAIK